MSSASSPSLKALLAQESIGHTQWTTLATSTPAQNQNPIWREHVTRWYFHVIDSIQAFADLAELHAANNENSANRYDRSIAHSATKIMDMYLSCACPVESQELARTNERAYKPIALACLFVALRNASSPTLPAETSARKAVEPAASAFSVENISIHTFLQMCQASHEIQVEYIAEIVDDITDFLKSLSPQLSPYHDEMDEEDEDETDETHPTFANKPHMPIVATHFYEVLREFLIENYGNLSIFHGTGLSNEVGIENCDGNNSSIFFQQVQNLLDVTISHVMFAENAPSLNTMASFLMAMQDSMQSFTQENNTDCAIMMRKAMLHMLTYYRLCGAYDLDCLRDIVAQLRLVDGHQATQVRHAQQLEQPQVFNQNQVLHQPDHYQVGQNQDVVHLIPDCDD